MQAYDLAVASESSSVLVMFVLEAYLWVLLEDLEELGSVTNFTDFFARLRKCAVEINKSSNTHS